jgi:hypothetical protein
MKISKPVLIIALLIFGMIGFALFVKDEQPRIIRVYLLVEKSGERVLTDSYDVTIPDTSELPDMIREWDTIPEGYVLTPSGVLMKRGILN